MNKLIASVTLVAMIAAPGIRAGELADQLHQSHVQAGQEASVSGQQALQNAARAIEPVIYAGKAVINGVEFVILKTVQGTLLVAEATVRGLELAVEGVKFVALKCKEGVIWVCEKAIQAGEFILDVTLETIEIVVDGVIYVAARLEEGIVFVAKKTWELAQKTGELVVKGVKFVVRKTKQGAIWVAEQAVNAARATRRAALVSELRMNLVGALSTGGVSERTMAYFARRAEDSDATVAKLAKACLTACEAFNSTY
jgi:predicted peroxiredoxin